MADRLAANLGTRKTTMDGVRVQPPRLGLQLRVTLAALLSAGCPKSKPQHVGTCGNTGQGHTCA